MELLSPATDGGHLANQATLAQAQQFQPQGTVASVASAESLQTPGAAPRSQSKRRRPSKSEQEVWTKSSTETLFTVRYVTAKEDFTRARNHVEVGAAWVLVAILVNKAEDTSYSVTQYKDKIKWLKKKWSMCRDDRNTTGNVPKAAAPLCLDLMLEHWAPNPGMQNTSLRDGATDLGDADTDSASTSGDSGCSGRSKRKKPNGECVEEGLRALADGVRVVGETMKARTSASSDTTLSQDVIASLSCQEEAFKQQTVAINELVRTLKVISSALRLEVKHAS